MRTMTAWMIVALLMLGGCSGEGQVTLNGGDEGAEIYIDGDLTGTMPSGSYSITLSEGKHEIELIKPISHPDKYDQYYAKKKIMIADKSSQTLSISMHRRQSPDYKEKYEAAQREKFASVLQSIESTMVKIPSGDFMMGSNSGGNDEKPVHRVYINSFKMGKYEVTQALWQAVMGSNPSRFKGDNRPVENVSWNDIQRFIGILNEVTGKHFRLPTEAEWEYVARAGSTTKYSWGNAVGHNRANCDGCGSQWDDKKTAPVGSFSANKFGLYDMHGNVWEWVQDRYHNSYKGAPSKGSAWESGSDSRRVLRGGSWNDIPYALRSALRVRDRPVNRDFRPGFRLVQD